jgi:hypothetical protein
MPEDCNWRRLATAGGLCAPLLFAACGGGDDSSSTSSTDAAALAAAAVLDNLVAAGLDRVWWVSP